MVEWDGEAFVPRSAYRARCDKEYVVNEIYRMEVREERSSRSHGHYFACLKDAFDNLPEGVADNVASPEHLRKYALIKAGYRDEDVFVAGSAKDAQQIAAFAKASDEYRIVLVSDCVVTVLTAKSQSARAMGKKDFQASKDAVLNIVAGLVEVDAETLKQNAGKAA